MPQKSNPLEKRGNSDVMRWSSLRLDHRLSVPFTAGLWGESKPECSWHWHRHQGNTFARCWLLQPDEGDAEAGQRRAPWQTGLVASLMNWSFVVCDMQESYLKNSAIWNDGLFVILKVNNSVSCKYWVCHGFFKWCAAWKIPIFIFLVWITL